LCDSTGARSQRPSEAAAGLDVLDTVRRLGPQLASMHWKDFDRRCRSDRLVEMGHGDLDLRRLLPKVVKTTARCRRWRSKTARTA